MFDNTLTKVAVGAAIVAVTASGLTYLFKRRGHPPTKWKRVGNVVEINCFPVKSCGPIQPMSIDCGISGVKEGLLRDRSFMVVTPENQFVTARAQPKLVLIKPQITSSKLILTAPETSNIEINLDALKHSETVQNAIWNVPVNTVDCGDDVSHWLSLYILGKDFGLRLAYYIDDSPNRPLHKWNTMYNITREDAGFLQDNSSFMVINQASVDELNKHLNHVVTSLQFRPNFVIKGPEAFEEDNWKWLKIGSTVVLRNLRPCDRCISVNVNPKTGERNPNYEPLKVLKKNPDFVRDGQAVMGTLFGLSQAGRVHVGDEVYVDSTL